MIAMVLPMAPFPSSGPVRLALVDDYDVILAGVAHLFDRYQDRIEVVALDADMPVSEDVDVALFDALAHPGAEVDLAMLINNRHPRHVAAYTWNFRTSLIEAALKKGAMGYLSKALPARDMVNAIGSIHGGQTVVSEAPSGSRLTTGLPTSEAITELDAGAIAATSDARE